MSDFWDNIEDNSGTEGGEYFTPGNYFVKVIRCKEINTENGTHAFVAECEVLESDNDETKVGSHPSLFVNMNHKWPKLAKGNIADFMRAGLASAAEAMGEEAPELNKQMAMLIKGEENILAGTFLAVRGWNKKTKEKKEDFTMLEWTGTGLQERRAKHQ